MVTRTLFCPRCGSAEVIRHGTTASGKQRYRCRSCLSTFCENPQPPGYTEEEKAQILAAYQERSSLRGLTRTFGVSRTTVSAWLKERAEALPPPGDDAPPGEGRRDPGTG